MAASVGWCLVAAGAEQSPTLQFNVIYQCAPPLSAKVFSCTGTASNALCDVQNYRDGKSAQRVC